MKKIEIDTLIIDLDNTIFDWMAYWHAYFQPLYARCLELYDGEEADLQKEIRKIHQTHRTSEYVFFIHEIEPIKNKLGADSISHAFRDALNTSRANKDKHLTLYGGVLKTLWEAKSSGTRIIAYTESLSFYSSYRLKHFGLDGVIDILFSPEDHANPVGISVDEFRRRAPEFYQLQITEVRHTPSGELKPNPDILSEIISWVGAEPTRCAYVGDSKFKDVAMAQAVPGVHDVFAEYGVSQNRDEYEFLKKVSHWTDADIHRENEINSRKETVIPTITLESSFSELLTHFEFQCAKNKPIKDIDQQKNIIEIWKKTVDVQQHFNDMSMRTRHFAITVVGIFLASIGLTYQHNLSMSINGIEIKPASLSALAALLSWGAFYLMDRYWYHVFLKGASIHAAQVENSIKSEISQIGLANNISKVSQSVTIFCKKLDSTQRLNWFYGIGGFCIAIILLITIFADRKNPALISSLPTGEIHILKPEPTVKPHQPDVPPPPNDKPK